MFPSKFRASFYMELLLRMLTLAGMIMLSYSILILIPTIVMEILNIIL